MKITRYSKMVVEHGIENAIDNVIAREKQFEADYIKLNPQDKDSRKRDADLVIFGAEMVRQEIHKAMKEWFSELEKVNS